MRQGPADAVAEQAWKEVPVTVLAEDEKRIWFLPYEYWQATKDMPPEQVDQLMSEVERLANARDLALLRQYPFIYIGRSSHRRGRALESPTEA